MSQVSKVRIALERALLGEERSDKKWRELIKQCVIDLKREKSIQRQPGVKRSPQEILRDKIKIIETSLEDPKLDFQEIIIASKIPNINIARVSECLNQAKKRYGSLSKALDRYRAEYTKKYPRYIDEIGLHPFWRDSLDAS
jgi:hypothetical protein